MSMGMPTIAPAFRKSREVLRHGQNQDQFDPLRRLKMRTAGEFDPALRTQVFLPKQKHRNQRRQCGNVDPMDLFQQGLIIEQADQEHRGHARCDPVDLLEVGAGKLRVLGRTVNLQHAERADHQHEAQQDPVEISIGNVARHEFSCPPQNSFASQKLRVRIQQRQLVRNRNH
jgi:hypothetical protein